MKIKRKIGGGGVRTWDMGQDMRGVGGQYRGGRGQGRCERRSEVFVIIQKNCLFFCGGGVGTGGGEGGVGGGGGGVRMVLNEELKIL